MAGRLIFFTQEGLECLGAEVGFWWSQGVKMSGKGVCKPLRRSSSHEQVEKWENLLHACNLAVGTWFETVESCCVAHQQGQSKWSCLDAVAAHTSCIIYTSAHR